MKSLALFSLLFAAPVFAYPAPVEGDTTRMIQRLEVTGCGDGVRARLEKPQIIEGIIHRSLYLDFDNLALTSEDHQSRLACAIDVDLLIPAGVQFRIDSGVMLGYADLQGSRGSVGFDYSFPATGDFVTVEQPLPAFGVTPINITAPASQPRYTSCATTPQLFRLSGAVFLDLEQGPLAPREIRITGQGAGYGVGWNWVCRKCDRP